MANDNIKLSSYLTKPLIKSKIIEMVGAIDAPRFMSSIISAYAANPALSECSNDSLVNAALLGESLKLSPSPQLGQYYMVPYKNKKAGTVEAQFQLGYKGYIQLAIRSGQYKKLNVLAIKEGELLNWDALSEDITVDLISDERAREQAATVGYYAMFEYTNGFKKALYWSKDKMLSHADRYSAAFSADGYTKTIKGKKIQVVSFADYEAGNYNQNDEWLYSSFWYKDFDGMALKTMLRQLISKWGIMSIELQKAYTSDAAVINDISKNSVDSTYIDVQEEIKTEANKQEAIGFDDTPVAITMPAETPTPEPIAVVDETDGDDIQLSF
jgi:recombination protein RecT